MRLTRSNDEPQLLDDLERLARSYGDPEREPRPLAAELTPEQQAEAEAAAAEAAAAEGEAGEPSALDDPFVRRFVRVSVHVKRYLPFYAGAAVWVLAMLLIQPLGRGGGDATADLASSSSLGGAATRTSSAVPAADVTPAEEVAAAPVFDDFGGSALTSSGSSFDFGDSDVSSDSSSFADDSFASSSDSSSFDDDDTASFDSDSDFGSSDFADEPEPLTIMASGYASSVGGTPLEQDPGSGVVPVAATGGNDNKRSFIRLRGDETTLRLKEAATGQVRADAGGIKACLITADWTPARGQALTAGPAFDASNCSTGVRDSSGLWTFDLANFAPLADTKGFALTPAAGTASTFEVRLTATAVPASA